MKVYFFALLLLSTSANCQIIDFGLLKTKVQYDATVFEQPDPKSNKIGVIRNPEYVFVVGKKEIPYFKYCKIVSDSLVGYAFQTLVGIDDETYDSLQSDNETVKIEEAKKRRPELAKALHEDVSKLSKLFDEYAKEVSNQERLEKNFGIAIRKFSYNNENDFYNIDFNVWNWTSKTLKYVWITVSAINPVGDLIKTKKITAIGPINPKEIEEYSFPSVFYSTIIDSIKITGLEYQLTNGARKSISGRALQSLVNQ